MGYSPAVMEFEGGKSGLVSVDKGACGGRGLVTFDNAQIGSLSPDQRGRVMLETVVAAGSESPVTRQAAIQAVVAGRILSLGIPNGTQLLYPASGLVDRNIEAGPHSTMILADLYAELERSLDARARIRAGVQLGDRALHYAAGCVGSRKVAYGRYPMGADERRRYATSMMHRGYGTASAIAQKVPDIDDARGVNQMIASLMGRLGDTIRIIASLVGQEKYLTKVGN